MAIRRLLPFVMLFGIVAMPALALDPAPRQQREVEATEQLRVSPLRRKTLTIESDLGAASARIGCASLINPSRQSLSLRSAFILLFSVGIFCSAKPSRVFSQTDPS